jgi:predicted lactoylglutathione lyase
MSRKIFVNLPVRDLKRAMAFFERLGFTFNPQFTDETAACMVISGDIYAMLLTHAKFTQFTRKPIADATQVTEVLVCLALESKAEVDKLAKAALAGGGTEASPTADHGFMYARSFHDLDGHVWELIWMDPAVIQKA